MPASEGPDEDLLPQDVRIGCRRWRVRARLARFQRCTPAQTSLDEQDDLFAELPMSTEIDTIGCTAPQCPDNLGWMEGERDVQDVWIGSWDRRLVWSTVGFRVRRRMDGQDGRLSLDRQKLDEI